MGDADKGVTVLMACGRCGQLCEKKEMVYN